VSSRKPKLVVFTGSGLSADSGVPTYRSNNGLWENHKIDEVANGLTWRDNRELIRTFYNGLRSNLKNVNPNSAHLMIADWQNNCSNFFDTIVLTQNVDNLLERAGCANVVHLHGEITKMTCVACGNTWDVQYNEIGAEDRCGKCNSLKGIRPYIVFFNENAPKYRDMYKALIDLDEHDGLIVIGTSGQVVNIDAYVKNARGLKVLNNLEPGPYIDDTLYHNTFYGNASKMCEPIDDIIKTHFMVSNE
jgi:NAD-dependent deacetylase